MIRAVQKEPLYLRVSTAAFSKTIFWATKQNCSQLFKIDLLISSGIFHHCPRSDHSNLPIIALYIWSKQEKQSMEGCWFTWILVWLTTVFVKSFGSFARMEVQNEFLIKFSDDFKSHFVIFSPKKHQEHEMTREYWNKMPAAKQNEKISIGHRVGDRSLYIPKRHVFVKK